MNENSNIKNQISNSLASKNPSASPVQRATSMAQLMQSVKTQKLTRGENVSGVITKLTPQEILVDVNAKSEAVVLEKDRRLLRSLLASLKVGDTVLVQVLNPESDMGHPVVSLRRFLDSRLWEEITKKEKERKPVTTFIREVTKGGYLVDTETGLSGFLPNSQVTISKNSGDSHNPQELIGKKIELFIVEQNRKLRKLIFSQKPVIGSKDFDELVKELHTGDKISPIITNIAQFGVFVTIPVKGDKFVDGLIHISEIAWDETETIPKDFKVGEPVDAIILGFDREAKRVDLSIKQLTKDPFEELVGGLVIEQKVKGTVTKVSSLGVTLDVVLPQGGIVEGLIRKDKIPPTKVYEIGESVEATIAQIETKKHRLLLVPVLTAKPIGYR